jgi:hypothetical protein
VQVRETPEAGIPLCCVRQPHGECEGRNTVIVVRLRPGDSRPAAPAPAPPELIARYHNRGKDHHAERVMMEDPTLLRAIRAFGDTSGAAGPPGAPTSFGAISQDPPTGPHSSPAGGTAALLSVYISLQPCHHSSSTTRISCTSDLQLWYRRELQPRGIALDLAVAYPYRSHWQPELMTQEEMLELGARSLWGPRYNSKGSSSDRMVRGGTPGG